MDERERRELGLRTRRSVLGDAHVDRALGGPEAFDVEFQDLITRYVWGEIWTRPGLDTRTRRLVVLGMMVALGRERELGLHVRAALEDGVSKDDVKEVLLQAAVYCGVPAAHGAFHKVSEILRSIESER
jgi:4-carboxymuconolactone decarboxylase